MPTADSAIDKFRALEDFSRGESPYHRLNPLVKLLIALFYTGAVTSFDRYDLTGVFPMLLYPFALFLITGFPFGFFAKRVLAVQSFAVMVGVWYPLLDSRVMTVGGLTVSVGWVAFLCLLLKSAAVVTAAFLLIASTGMDNICAALRALCLPRIFVLQLLLTYRYIAVLLRETGRVQLAYSLKAPGRRGVHIREWGPLAGQILLRAFDRAGRVYEAMRLRGFHGEYITGETGKIKPVEAVCLILCTGAFLFARFVNLPRLLGGLL